MLNITVNRTYECKNEECGGEVCYEEKCTAPFRQKCPLCGKRKLLLKEGKCGISNFVDTNKAKTVGSLAEKNTIAREKRGEMEKPKETPWWRKNKKKIDFNVLKNPRKYIEKGN